LVKPDSVTPLSAPSVNDSGRYFVKQVWPQQAVYAPIPQDEIILVGRGSGADWLASRFLAGMIVQVNFTTDPDWRDLVGAIGGGPVLVKNGRIVEDPDPPAPQERDRRHPVIAAGISRDGRTLTIVEVDGRQPSLSIGLTRPELAAYGHPVPPSEPLQVSSTTPAVTVSGGTVTAGAAPGEGVLHVQSGAAAGTARVFVVNHIQRLVVSPDAVSLVPGAGWNFSFAGEDATGNQVTLPNAAGTWVVNPPWLGTFSGPGEFVAGEQIGTGMIDVRIGGAADQVRVAIGNTARAVTQFDRGNWTFRGDPDTVTGSVA